VSERTFGRQRGRVETKRYEDESRLLLPICPVWRVDYMSENKRSKEDGDLRKAILDERRLMVVVVVLRLWSSTFLFLERVPSYGLSEVSAAAAKALVSQAHTNRGTVSCSYYLWLVYVIPARLELLKYVL
jgi:hypothetical protein